MMGSNKRKPARRPMTAARMAGKKAGRASGLERGSAERKAVKAKARQDFRKASQPKKYEKPPAKGKKVIHDSKDYKAKYSKLSEDQKKFASSAAMKAARAMIPKKK